MADRSLVIVGTGGHAKVIVDIFLDAGVHPIGCTGVDLLRSDLLEGDLSRGDLLGVEIIGGDDQLPRLFAAGARQAFIAIGDNRKRRELSRAVQEIGFQLVNAVSTRASVSRFARLGTGVAIMPGAIVNADAEIGDGVIVNTGSTVDHDCVIGPFAHIAPGTNLAGCVRVGEGVLLGIGTRVIPGITIGDWSIVGAGSVIIRNLEPNIVAAGVPASILKPGNQS